MASYNQSGQLNATIKQSSLPVPAETMLYIIRRRSCLSSLFLLKVAVALMVVVACHLLLQGIQNGTVDDSSVLWSQFDPLDGQRAHRQYQKGGTLHKCEVPRLYPPDHTADNVHCKRFEPHPNSCQIAQDLFLSKPPDKCEGEGPFSICQIKTKHKQHYEVRCDSKVCKAGLSLGTIDLDVGTLKWREYSNPLDLQHQIQLLVNSNIHLQHHHDFCFIKCLPSKQKEEEEEEDETDEEQKEDEQKEDEQKEEAVSTEQRYYWEYVDITNNLDLEDSLPKQLLILPRHFSKPLVKTEDKNKISFNVYLLDSISHSHFFRSLPKSIHKLKQIKMARNTSVFNFNLMQSLKGRTYENLQALFAGELYNTNNPFGVQDMPPKAVQTWKLLQSMKEAGYQTMWTEDLCWTWEWGIAKNMVVHSPDEDMKIRWKKLRDVLVHAGIDGLNFSLASCEILKANGIRDTFHGPSMVCYNKKHHHHYTLEYLKMQQSQLNAVKQPFFHFTIANVAHEDTGRRVQALDDDLSEYFEFLATQDNMVTVLLADHGNSYGAFMQKSIEARVEMFHPVFIILMSENVAKELGHEKLSALSTNQEHLVSILDLYYTLQSLSPGGSVAVASEHKNYDVSQEGLLVPLSPNRTCDSIPRINPNICICSDYEKAVANDSSRAEVARAIVHKINEVILEKVGSGNEFGACRQLELKWFGNVKESHPKTDVTVMKMDLHLDSGMNSGNTEEVLFVIIKSEKKDSSLVLELLGFERMTSYSQFDKCKDPQVPTKLCVCDLPS